MEKSFTPSAIRKRKWRKENPERYLTSNRERNWKVQGIDVDVARLLWSSKSECQICGRKDKRLTIDHSHKTGVVRGILCIHCNHVLGLYKDDPELLRKAAEYLEIDRT